MKSILVLCFISAVICKLSEEYARENNLFAIAKLDEFSKTHKSNVLYSSVSVETLLGLISLGAKGSTAEQIRKVLRLPQEDEKLKKLVKGLLDELDEVKHILPLANEIFLAEGIKVEAKFLNTTNEFLGSGIETVDFGKIKEAVSKINSLVSAKTSGKIKDLLQEDQLSDTTRMVVVSAIDFKGKFQHHSKGEDTKKRDFHLLNNNTIQVETMKLTGRVKAYTSTDHNVTFIMLPYEGIKNRVYLNIAFPNEVKNFKRMVENFKDIAIDRHLKLQEEYATVYLPRFKLESTLDMKPSLKSMGIRDIFAAPDLSGITKESLKVDLFTQKVLIEVDEEGTIVADVTADSANATSLLLERPEPKIYRVDKPFYYAVTLDYAAILSGRLINPSEEYMS